MWGEGTTYQGLVAAAAGRGLVSDWLDLGAGLVELRKWGAACGCFSRVVEADPGNHRAWMNWGWSAHLLGESEVAAERLGWAVELAPFEGMPRALLCQVLAVLGREDEACEMGRLGVEFEPSPPVNHVGYGLALLNARRWRKGWREFEWRFAYKMPEMLSRPHRWWRGERVGHLYLECEMGAGDSIFALRWVWAAAELADRVTLYAQKELYSLFAEGCGLPGNVTVYPMPRPLPVEVDAFCPLMSLPAALEVEDFGWQGPYVGSRLGCDFAEAPLGVEKKIGICWAGSAVHDNAHHRDAPLAYWMCLTEVPGVRLHALQLGPASSQLQDVGCYGLVEDRAPEIMDFSDTVRVLDGLDLLVTVDTSVANLGGAMGIPTWVLINQRGRDFRWGASGDGVGFYPSIRLFRRALDEDSWMPGMKRVAAALREMAS